MSEVGVDRSTNRRPNMRVARRDEMNKRKRVLLTPLALAAVVAWGAAGAAQPGQTATGQPYDAAVRSAHSGAKKQDTGHWGERFQGKGNVTNSRCQGMSRGANCITAASRKDASRRAAAARDGQVDATVPGTGNTGRGGKN